MIRRKSCCYCQSFMSNSGDIQSPRGLPHSSDEKLNKQATGLLRSLSYLRRLRKKDNFDFSSKHTIKNSQFYFWVPIQACYQNVFEGGALFEKIQRTFLIFSKTAMGNSPISPRFCQFCASCFIFSSLFFNSFLQFKQFCVH